MELRFVSRSAPAPELGENVGRITRVLQQRTQGGGAWPHCVPPGAWEDVPFVEPEDEND